MLASNLNMSRDDAERWIVNLIRNAKLDAKIDAKEVRPHCSHQELIITVAPLILHYGVHYLHASPLL